MLSVICHLGFFFGGFILPLIVRRSEGGRDEFTRHHATEALNLDLTFMVCGLVTFVTMTSVAPDSDLTSLVVLALFLAMAGVGTAWAIRAAMKANRGEWWTYPLIFRFVKGARPRTRRAGR